MFFFQRLYFPLCIVCFQCFVFVSGGLHFCDYYPLLSVLLGISGFFWIDFMVAFLLLLLFVFIFCIGLSWLRVENVVISIAFYGVLVTFSWCWIFIWLVCIVADNCSTEHIW